jgi:DNA repair protein RecO (recombination protein O)
MQLHNTKGIVIRTVKYGETSLIVTAYTELFGLQSYMVKGVRQTTKKGNTKANYFQPAAILDMAVYHNELKNLQFVKEYHWHFLYQQVFFNVVKNAVAGFMVELLQHALKQPEANVELYDFIEENLQYLDVANPTATANLPLYFTLQLSALLGFQIHGQYTEQYTFFDIEEGCFTQAEPLHQQFISGNLAKATSLLVHANNINAIEQLQITNANRASLLQHYIQYFSTHVANFGTLKVLPILQQILH